MFDEKNKRDKKNCVTDPLFATLQSGASWPAGRSSRRTRRKTVDFVWLCICISGSTPMMLTCIEVLTLV
jgi:hypothetical protein